MNIFLQLLYNPRALARNNVRSLITILLLFHYSRLLFHFFFHTWPASVLLTHDCLSACLMICLISSCIWRGHMKFGVLPYNVNALTKSKSKNISSVTFALLLPVACLLASCNISPTTTEAVAQNKKKTKLNCLILKSIFSSFRILHFSFDLQLKQKQ